MPTIKKLQFANGTDVTEPTDLSLESSTDHLKTYADDAAYVADNGAASAGDIYINTTMNTARLYAGGQWWSVVIKENAIIVDDNFKLVDNGDNTKVGKFDVSNVPTGTTKTYAVPAITTSADVLVTQDATQELKNKTIDGNLNTLTNLDFGTLSGEVNPQNGGTGISNPAGATLTRTGAFDLNITCTAETDVTMPVSGTLATLGDIDVSNLTGTVAPDQGGLGTDASAFNGVVKADGAGNFSASAVTNTDISATAAIARSKVASGTANHIVINDGTGVLSSEATLAKSRGGSGQDNTNLTFPSTGKLATLAGSETLSSKTLLENTVDNFLAFNEEAAAPATPASGKVAVYAKSDSKIYKKDSTGAESEIGAGGSGTGRNYLQDWFDGTKPIGTIINGLTSTGNRSTSGGANLQWGASSTSNMTVTLETVTPLRQTSSIKIDSLNTTSGAFVESPMFLIDNADLGKPLSVEFDIGDIAANTNYDIVVMQYTLSGTYVQTISVAGNASTGTPSSAQLPTGTTKFRGFFITAGDAGGYYYSLRIRKLAAVDDDFQIDSLFVGPQSLTQGAIVTGYQSYTPTISNFGTVTNISFKYMRSGSHLIGRGSFTTGSPVSGIASFTLPTGLTSGRGGNIGMYFRNATVSSNNGGVILSTTGSNLINFSSCTIFGSTASNAMLAANGNSVADASESVNIEFSVEIAEWSSGTTTLADRAVEEYASNSNTADANDTSSFVNGVNGSLLPGALTALRTKRVQFSSPILPTDALILEISFDRIKWSEVLMDDNGNSLDFQQQNTATYGVGIRQTSGLASNQINVQFGQYFSSTGSTYGAAGAGWNLLSIGYWRVRKVSSGAAVGFPIAPANITLVNTSDNYSGNTKLGLMQYQSGASYNGGITPTILLTGGGGTLTSVERCNLIPYQVADGSWRLKFNIATTVSSQSRSGVTMTCSGITTKNISNFWQATLTTDGNINMYSVLLPNTSQIINCGHAAATTTRYLSSGDIELDSKPTWAY